MYLRRGGLTNRSLDEQGSEKGKREWGKGKREWGWEKTSEPCIDAEPDQGHWPSIGY